MRPLSKGIPGWFGETVALERGVARVRGCNFLSNDEGPLRGASFSFVFLLVLSCFFIQMNLKTAILVDVMPVTVKCELLNNWKNICQTCQSITGCSEEQECTYK